MNTPAYPECSICTYRHGPGPCLKVRVIPAGVAGYDAARCPEWAIGPARRGAARNNSLRAERKAARLRRAGKKSADSRYGRERKLQAKRRRSG